VLEKIRDRLSGRLEGNQALVRRGKFQVLPQFGEKPVFCRIADRSFPPCGAFFPGDFIQDAVIEELGSKDLLDPMEPLFCQGAVVLAAAEEPVRKGTGAEAAAAGSFATTFHSATASSIGAPGLSSGRASPQLMQEKQGDSDLCLAVAEKFLASVEVFAKASAVSGDELLIPGRQLVLHCGASAQPVMLTKILQASATKKRLAGGDYGIVEIETLNRPMVYVPTLSNIVLRFRGITVAKGKAL
jgi:hypothetical protein